MVDWKNRREEVLINFSELKDEAFTLIERIILLENELNKVDCYEKAVEFDKIMSDFDLTEDFEHLDLQ